MYGVDDGAGQETWLVVPMGGSQGGCCLRSVLLSGSRGDEEESEGQVGEEAQRGGIECGIVWNGVGWCKME